MIDPQTVTSLLAGPLGIAGGGGILGLGVGYAIKKLFKILLLGGGLIMLIIMYFVHRGWIQADYAKIQEGVNQAVQGMTHLLNQLVGETQKQLTANHADASIIAGVGAFSLGIAAGIRYG